MKNKVGRKAGKKRRLLFSAFFCVAGIYLGLLAWKMHTEKEYAHGDVICEPNSIISWEERIREDRLGAYEGRLRNLEKGDILLTPCSHAFGWRNGHAAIVIDEEKELTLESVVLGSPSTVQNVSKWRGYPGVMVFRLKDATKEERAAIASYAADKLLGVDYGFLEDLLEHVKGSKMRDTHCAHLVWSAYMEFGYNLDGDGGIVVTPKDISLSDNLYVIEKYNVDNW